MSKAWERQEGETDRAFRAFGVYLGQEKRSLRQASTLAKTSYHRIATWSRSNEWVSRAAAWDEHLAAVQAAAAEVAARSTGETIGLSLAAGLEVTRIAFERYLANPDRIEELKFADLVDALEQLGKLDQLLGGNATERVETSTTSRSRADLLSDLWTSKSGRELLAEAKSTLAGGPRKGIAGA